MSYLNQVFVLRVMVIIAAAAWLIANLAQSAAGGAP